MELITLFATLSLFAVMMLAACGVWATYWAVMHGCRQMIAGLQSIDGRLAELSRK